jgi:hypothetical protein
MIQLEELTIEISFFSGYSKTNFLQKMRNLRKFKLLDSDFSD